MLRAGWRRVYRSIPDRKTSMFNSSSLKRLLFVLYNHGLVILYIEDSYYCVSKQNDAKLT